MRGLIHFQSKGLRKISGPTCCVTSKIGWAVFLAAAVVMLQGVDAQADFAGFSGLTITGEVEFDDSFALAENTTSFGGSFSTTEGGATTTSTFDESDVTGDNPLSGTLSDLGDGFGLVAYAAGLYNGDDSEFGIGMDLFVDVTNTSATIPYLVTFGLVWDNSVDSSGDDAYADSEFTLDDPTGEIFFTDLISDTCWGDEVGGVLTGGYGDLLTDIGTDSFTILLDPLDTWFFDGALTMEGGAFETDSSFDGSFSAAFTVTDVTVVPVPGALLLGSIGLSFAGCLLRRFKDRN